MKHKFLHLLLFMLSISLSSFAIAQSNKVTVDFHESTLNQIIKEIGEQASLSVVYNVNDINTLEKFSIKATNEDVNKVVSKLLKNSNINFTIKDNHLVLSAKSDIKSTLKHTVKGKIVDGFNEPLIGVSIVIKGTASGTVTNIDGEYQIEVPSGKTIEVSYIGYGSQSFKISKADTINITLTEDTETLDEVVVTALGIKRSQKALSYNVQEVKGGDLTAVKDANFMNSLSGKVAGVNINSSSSGVGGATRVVMRGSKSISANNNALYVIDGVPIFNTNAGNTEGEYSNQPKGEGISDLNPEDIESMSVLSGPAAAALYGSNAAQGVVLITTKKGQEGKVKITLSNNSTFSRPFVMPKFQKEYVNKPGNFKSWGNKEQSPFGTYDAEDFFNTGTNIQNSVTLSVGTAKNQTYLSTATTNAKGIIPNNKYNRYNFTVRNTTSFLDDKMTLDLGFNYIIQEDQNLMAQGQYFNPLPSLYLFPRGENFDAIRMYEVYDPIRQVNLQNWSWGTAGLGMQNPYWIVNRNLYGTKKQRYMANASLKYEILDWLNIAGRVRIDNATNDFTDKRYAGTNPLWTAGSQYGFYKAEKNDDRQVYADLLANIDKRFGDFTLSANIGASISQVYFDGKGFQGGLKDISNVFTLYNIDYSIGQDTRPLESAYKQRTNSLFISSEFGWKSMVYLTLTGRNDWDSALHGTEQSSFFYPSVGLSGVISEMVKLPEFINYLKVRGSFASVGSAIPRNLTSDWKYKWDAATSKWVTNSYRPIGKLYPEKTNSWEAGLSAKFLNNRISFDVTWYKSNTLKQTLQIPLSASSGWTSMYVQSGNVQNKGIEMALGLNNQWGKFNWNSNITFSMNKNKIVELLDNYEDPITGENYSLEESAQGGIGSSKFILRKGGTMGDLYTTTRLQRDHEGNIWINPNTGNVVKETLKNPEKVGSVLPKSNLGWRNDFSYKGINLGFMISARFGGVVMSPTQAIMDEYGVSKASAAARNQGGIPVNKGTIDTEQYYSTVGGANGVLSHYVYSATNVRLQEASIGYTFPAKWFNNKMDLNLSVVGRNLWMIYNKAPFDPELTASTGTFFQGIDYFMQPSLRNIGFNIRVQF